MHLLHIFRCNLMKCPNVFGMCIFLSLLLCLLLAALLHFPFCCFPFPQSCLYKLLSCALHYAFFFCPSSFYPPPHLFFSLLRDTFCNIVFPCSTLRLSLSLLLILLDSLCVFRLVSSARPSYIPGMPATYGPHSSRSAERPTAPHCCCSPLALQGPAQR